MGKTHNFYIWESLEYFSLWNSFVRQLKISLIQQLRTEVAVYKSHSELSPLYFFFFLISTLKLEQLQAAL